MKQLALLLALLTTSTSVFAHCKPHYQKRLAFYEKAADNSVKAAVGFPLSVVAVMGAFSPGAGAFSGAALAGSLATSAKWEIEARDKARADYGSMIKLINHSYAMGGMQLVKAQQELRAMGCGDIALDDLATKVIEVDSYEGFCAIDEYSAEYMGVEIRDILPLDQAMSMWLCNL